MPANIGGVFRLGKLATRECLLDGLGRPGDVEPSCWPGPVGVWRGNKGVFPLPGPVKGVRIYCFQNSLSSLESNTSLPPALSSPPFFNDAINSGVGEARLKLCTPAALDASCELLVTEELLVCELLFNELIEASEWRDVLDEFALAA